MSFSRVERLSESSLQIICGKCIKEARILWSEQAGFDNNHMLLVLCHGEPRMVIVDEFQIRIRKTEDAPVERLQLTWEQLRDLDDDYVEGLHTNALAGLKMLQDRVEGIEKYKGLKASVQPAKRATRFEMLASELEE